MARYAGVSPVRLVSDGRDDLVSELVSLFEAQFAAKMWPERVRLLEEVFEHLEENSRDRQSVVPTFARIVEKLVEGVGSPELSCDEQAHIYAASRAARHRRQAKLWFGRAGFKCDGSRTSRPSLRCAPPA